MKKLIFILCPIIVILIFVVIFFVYDYKEKRSISYKDEITIKIADNLPTIKDYVSSDDLDKLDSKIIWKDALIIENSIYTAGTYTGEFKFYDEIKKVKLNVVDNVKPTIEGVKDITIYVGDTVDLLKDITTNDNSKDELDVKVEGEYDTSTEGEYNLKYVVKDKSDNEESQDFKLIVKKKQVVIPQTSYEEDTDYEEYKYIGTSSKGYKIEMKNGIYYVNDILIANKTYKLPSTYNPKGLLQVFVTNFNNMKTSAKEEGISLTVISGFRSYNSQYAIYNSYAKRDGVALADRYSARAGHSEHQTGLAADINSLYQSFINTKEGKWLNDNCYKYGFIIRYPNGKESITGYMYEPWHIRYVGVDIATILYNNGDWISLEEYLGITSKY